MTHGSPARFGRGTGDFVARAAVGGADRSGSAVLKRGAQLGSSAVNPAAHRAQLDAEGSRDLLVGETLDITEHHGGPVLRRERLERGLHVVVQVTVVEGLRRGGLGAR